MATSATNVNDFLESLNGGVFKEKLGLILSEAAMGTVLNGQGSKKGKVTIELTLNRIGENDQVIITHKLSQSIPTMRGKKSEEDITETPMFVCPGGIMTIEPPKENFNGQFELGPSGTRSKVEKIK